MGGRPSSNVRFTAPAPTRAGDASATQPPDRQPRAGPSAPGTRGPYPHHAARSPKSPRVDSTSSASETAPAKATPPLVAAEPSTAPPEMASMLATMPALSPVSRATITSSVLSRLEARRVATVASSSVTVAGLSETDRTGLSETALGCDPRRWASMTRRAVSPEVTAGPLAAFTKDLRDLRDRYGSGAPSVDEISKREGIPRSTLFASLRGDRLPSRRVVAAFAKAWGGSEAVWLSKRSATEASLVNEPMVGSAVARHITNLHHLSADAFRAVWQSFGPVSPITLTPVDVDDLSGWDPNEDHTAVVAALLSFQLLRRATSDQSLVRPRHVQTLTDIVDQLLSELAATASIEDHKNELHRVNDAICREAFSLLMMANPGGE